MKLSRRYLFSVFISNACLSLSQHPSNTLLWPPECHILLPFLPEFLGEIHTNFGAVTQMSVTLPASVVEVPEWSQAQHISISCHWWFSS
jgi:hypothetical protein